MKQRMFTLLLVLVLCLGLLPMGALAAEDTGASADEVTPFALAVDDEGMGEKISNNNIPVNISYGNGCLDMISIEGAEVFQAKLSDESTENKKIVEIVLEPDTAIGVEVTAKFIFSNTSSSFPGIMTEDPATVRPVTIAQVISRTNSIVNSKIENRTENKATAYLFADKQAAKKKNYITYILNYSIKAYDDGPDEASVSSIAINSPPTKTTYKAEEYFDPAGLTLTATLTDGQTSAPFHECSWSPDGPLSSADKEITISYAGKEIKQEIVVESLNRLEDVTILPNEDGSEGGWFIYKPYLLDETQAIISPSTMNYEKAKAELGQGKIVVPYGRTAVDVELSLASPDTKVMINGEEQAKVADDPSKCRLVFPSKVAMSAENDKNTFVYEGEATTVVLKKEGEKDKTYKFVCYTQGYTGLPTKVAGYLCVDSQFTNIGNHNPNIGINAISTLLGGNVRTVSGSLQDPPCSLGGFGGYITYYYKDAIIDDPKNPFGVDFVVYGNSVGPNNGYYEPAQVWVSETGNDDDWYALAGSLHYEDGVDWNLEMLYEKTENGLTKATNKQTGEVNLSKYSFPWKQRYPLHDWKDNEDAILVSGIYLSSTDVDAYGNNRAIFPEFGYTDRGLTTSTNVAESPYTGNIKNGLETTAHDGFDLAWAVDAQGNPVQLPNGIHYVKIVSATAAINGALGECSPEITMMRTAAPAAQEVGVTEEPSLVTVDGQTVSFNENHIAENVSVSGAFFIDVKSTDTANVFIGSDRTAYRTYSAMPEHPIIRVIVQEKDKEPWIGYIKLVEGTGPQKKSTTVSFDVAGGSMDDKKIQIYTEGMSEDQLTFPTPTRRYSDGEYNFLGWFDADGNQYTKYTAGMPESLTLTAKWKIPDENVTVSFRLIGSTKSSGDIDLQDHDYKGAKYVTWISTKDVTVPVGSTVLTAFEKALAEAKLSYQIDGGYITSITSPDGVEMREMTNGPRSGWMYTINGKHGNLGVAQQELKQGDNVIFHYVNDYAYEVSDWDDIGGSGSSFAKDDTFFDRWLEAEDKNPEDINPDQPGADKTDLKAAIEKAEALTAKDYTVDSWKALADALTAAKAVQADKDAAQKEVDAATKALTEATKALVKKPAKEMTFTDLVSADGIAHWATDAIEYVYQAKLMNGMSDTTFAPDVPLTRGMLVTMLYRLENKPAVTGTSPFTDVAVGTWYTDAVTWANANKIVKGVSETSFAPNQEITREQMATMLYRYANVKGYDTTAQTELNAYTDAASVSDYATDALRWSVKTGLINGMTDTTLVPQGKATRAQTATVLMRFIENVAK